MIDRNYGTAAKFWMVYGGNGPATHPHNTMNEAKQEAQRLARKHPGVRFFVLEATEFCETQAAVTWDRVDCTGQPCVIPY